MTLIRTLSCIFLFMILTPLSYAKSYITECPADTKCLLSADTDTEIHGLTGEVYQCEARENNESLDIDFYGTSADVMHTHLQSGQRVSPQFTFNEDGFIKIHSFHVHPEGDAINAEAYAVCNKIYL